MPTVGRGLVRFSVNQLSNSIDVQAENLYLTPSQVWRTLGASDTRHTDTRTLFGSPRLLLAGTLDLRRWLTPRNRPATIDGRSHIVLRIRVKLSCVVLLVCGRARMEQFWFAYRG